MKISIITYKKDKDNKYVKEKDNIIDTDCLENSLEDIYPTTHSYPRRDNRDARDDSDHYGFQDPGGISFFRAAFEKIVTIFLSVKVQVIASILTISTWLLMHDFINGGEWTTVNTTVISIIVGLRETFKMSAINYARKKNRDKFRV